MRPHSFSNVALALHSLLVLGSTFALGCTAPATDAPETVFVERTASGLRHTAPITGKLVTSVDDATAATIAFFARHRGLGLDHPESSLAPRNVERDELGMTHVKLQQLAHGIPVRGAEIVAHYAADGSVASIDAKIVDGLDAADPKPVVSSAEAFAAAQKHVAQSEPSLLPSDLRAEKAPALTFLPSGRLVWATRVAADAPAIVRTWTFVDAKTGAVESYDDLHRLSATSIGVLGQSKKIEVELRSTGYVLRDTSRTPQGIDTGDLKTGTDTSKNTYVTSTNGTTWDAAGVDAHAHTAMVYDYYKATHGRLSYDGANGQLVSFVHYDKNLDDAFNMGNGQIVYGDGAPGRSIAMSAALDIVAHEVSHGVTEKSSGLVYQTQSGALNEAFSDIMGAAVEHHYRPDPVKNWTHSEDAYGGKALRDFKNPRAGANIGVELPRHMKEYVTLPLTTDNGGVHVNSAIPYHTAYLMTMGGTNEVSKINVPRGIGWENLAKVWYRANTRYFTTTTSFVEAAKGTLTAAKDLALSAEDQDTIECAWIATGVLEGTCKTKAPEPKPTDPKPQTQSDDKKTDNDDDQEDEETTPPKKPGKKSSPVVLSGGCSASPADSNGSGLLATLVVIGGLAIVTRRRRRGTRV